MVNEFVTIKIENEYLKRKYKKIDVSIDIGDEIKIRTNTLTKGSHVMVECYCDVCGKMKEMMYKTYYKLTNKGDKKYYCHKCSKIKKDKTMLDLYGVIHPCQNADIMQKVKDTNNEKYGVDMPSQLLEFENKKKQTNLEKYGVEYPQQNKEIKNKSYETMIEKYGVKTPIENVEIKEKIKNTCLSKYGVKNPFCSVDIRKKITENTNKNTIEKYKNEYNIVSIDSDNYSILCKKGHIYEIYKSLFNQRNTYNVENCTICNPIGHFSSDSENDILDFIKENYDGEIIENSRNIINPYELDIYLPELKLAFEFNGVFWHSELYKEKNYHNMKSDLCEKAGIQLIHIWEDDWKHKKEIVKSIILNKLSKIKNKIYARKTIIKEIKDNKLVKNFLNKNHLQGKSNSTIKLGLFYKNELVSLLTLGKKRLFMNSKSGEYELLRFCNKLNTNVVGGASKLFKYFIKNYKYSEIITYADRSYSQGKLYESLGFTFISKTSPNYYYVIDGIRKQRFNFRKDVLVKEGYDPSKTEHEIMLEKKVYRIYNSGNLKYKMNFNSSI